MSEISGYPKALSHAGSGGGVSLKTLNIKNDGTEALPVIGAIVNGKSTTVTIEPAATETVQYVEPATGQNTILLSPNMLAVTAQAAGITISDGSIIISDAAEDGASIALRVSSLG